MKIKAKVEQYVISNSHVKMSICFERPKYMQANLTSIDIDIPKDISILDSLSTEVISEYLRTRCRFYCEICNSPMYHVRVNLVRNFMPFCETCKMHRVSKEVINEKTKRICI